MSGKGRRHNTKGGFPWRAFLELSKVRITGMVTLTTAMGFILAADGWSMRLLYVTVGIFLLACGSSALNHYQERRQDALMHRTKARPLPRGEIEPRHAVWFALSLAALGTLILELGVGLTACVLGLLALLWYNGVYTYLKRLSAFAVIPGSLIGAIPPVVGWVAGGGDLLDPRIAVVAFFFFLWQVPHFWLLLLMYGQEYERAGFPSLTRVFSSPQLARITFVWMLAVAVACLLIPLFGFVPSPVMLVALVLCSFWLAWQALRFFRSQQEGLSLGLAFRGINLFALLVLSLLSLGKLLA